MRETLGFLMKNHESLRKYQVDLGRPNILGVPIQTSADDKRKKREIKFMNYLMNYIKLDWIYQ